MVKVRLSICSQVLLCELDQFMKYVLTELQLYSFSHVFFHTPFPFFLVLDVCCCHCNCSDQGNLISVVTLLKLL